MAYEPTNWKSGDIVTSAKLNKMEQGIAGAGPLIVNAHIDNTSVTLDKTFEEIHGFPGAVVVYSDDGDVYNLTYRDEEGVEFVCSSFLNTNGNMKRIGLLANDETVFVACKWTVEGASH